MTKQQWSTNQTINESNKVAMIGCGNMAQAIIGGLVQSGWSAPNIMACNPSPEKPAAMSEQYGTLKHFDNIAAAEFGDIILFAVKPQKLPQVCTQLKHLDFSHKLIISVAAGFETQSIEDILEQPVAIVRAMPNTPAMIAQGATGLFANAHVTAQQKQIATIIFDAIGQSCWIEDEANMDIVTAIAGSSPAYVFLFMQAMLEQAVSSGLPEKEAFNLITQAFSGAAQLARAIPEKSLKTLRQEVTSPGGTTAAAIDSFESNDFSNIIKHAVRASIQRGKELACQK